MNKIKTQLKLAPKTRDDEYDRRKSSMKELHSALRSYTSAMEKAKASVKTVVGAMENVRKVFEQMVADPATPQHTADTVAAFGASCDRVSGETLVTYNRSMDEEVLPAIRDLKQLYDECSKMESDRNKLMAEYDMYREEVRKTESSYQKKGKDLNTSKSYSGNVAKRDDCRTRFEAADQKFKDTHDYLLANKVTTISHTLGGYLKCSSNLFDTMAMELKSLYQSLQNDEYAVGPPN